ncbi:hypothetical protein [Saccharibacillus sacchari]|uniref:hypothetical protein n=1 Tax=Saccharibacillus sacchari TaxID=456493 RepID=UPI0014718C53|nr:hypothetical protein [Saccharibacillus sacchari]
MTKTDDYYNDILTSIGRNRQLFEQIRKESETFLTSFVAGSIISKDLSRISQKMGQITRNGLSLYNRFAGEGFPAASFIFYLTKVYRKGALQRGADQKLVVFIDPTLRFIHLDPAG